MVSLTISPEDSAEQRKQVNELMEAAPDDAPKDEKKSAHALAEGKYAFGIWWSKMNDAHRREYADHVASIAAKIKAAP
jgi:hypothetical protein